MAHRGGGGNSQELMGQSREVDFVKVINNEQFEREVVVVFLFYSKGLFSLKKYTFKLFL